MNINIRITLIVIIGLALTMGAGCATSKTWISNPAAQTAGNPYYEAKIEPLKSANKFFVSFRLVVTNRTDKNLDVDWNKTRYIYNGRNTSGYHCLRAEFFKSHFTVQIAGTRPH